MPKNGQLELLFSQPVASAAATPGGEPLQAASADAVSAGALGLSEGSMPSTDVLAPPIALQPPPPVRPGVTIIATPCPDPLPPGARWREVATEQQAIGFVLLRSRRRSIGFVIADDGLRVTAPNWVTLTQIDDAVREKSRWILAKLRDWQARKEQLAMSETRWQAGGELPYLGKRIVLGLNAENRQAKFSSDVDAPNDGDTLWLALPAHADSSRIRDAAQAWLQQRAGTLFGTRLAHFLQISGLKIRRWRLSAAATRWGSCTSDGNIMLNWRLIHFAPAIIDYVIAHELAHLREMNHSQDFWAEVGQILPGFEEAKNVLRRHDPKTLPQF
ncbi:YgjP-like metallopeptidase domain-containing protein [Bordetella tumbae]|uniref:M48 family metallopeptidase n=1 Tax=Bordetella tumbae TaxID=1649139 RepID=UPI0039EF2B7D